MLILTDDERFKCSICMNTLYNAMSIYPCLHSFCAGCIARWQEEHHNCPMCRVDSIDIVLNRDMRALVDEFLKQNPNQARTPEDILDLDLYELKFLWKSVSKTTDSAQRVLESMTVRDTAFKMTKYSIEKAREMMDRIGEINKKHGERAKETIAAIRCDRESGSLALDFDELRRSVLPSRVRLPPREPRPNRRQSNSPVIRRLDAPISSRARVRMIYPPESVTETRIAPARVPYSPPPPPPRISAIPRIQHPRVSTVPSHENSRNRRTRTTYNEESVHLRPFRF